MKKILMEIHYGLEKVIMNTLNENGFCIFFNRPYGDSYCGYLFACNTVRERSKNATL